MTVIGLTHKTVDLFADAADLASLPVIIQGTIFASGVGNPEWYDLTAPITLSGIYPVVVSSMLTAVSPGTDIAIEPEINYIRIISSLSEVGAQLALPRSLKARFAGLWMGNEPWVDMNNCLGRMRGQMGNMEAL